MLSHHGCKEISSPAPLCLHLNTSGRTPKRSSLAFNGVGSGSRSSRFLQKLKKRGYRTSSLRRLEVLVFPFGHGLSVLTSMLGSSFTPTIYTVQKTCSTHSVTIWVKTQSGPSARFLTLNRPTCRVVARPKDGALLKFCARTF